MNHQEFRFVFGSTFANLPHDYHFGAFVNECIKQVNHVINWMRRQNQFLMDNLGFSLGPENESSPKSRRTLSMSWEFTSGTLSFDEDPLKHTLISKNDIAETVAERDIVKLKPRTVYSLIRKIKQTGVYKKFIICGLEKFRIGFNKPSKFLS